jgi:hypothetical protein
MRRVLRIRFLLVVVGLLCTASTALAQDAPLGGLRNGLSLDLFETGYMLIPDFVNAGLVQIPVSINFSRAIGSAFVLSINPHLLFVQNPLGNPSGTNFSIGPSVEFDWHLFTGPASGFFLGGWIQAQYGAGTLVSQSSVESYGYLLGAAMAGVGGYRYVAPSGLLLETSGRLGVSYTKNHPQAGDLTAWGSAAFLSLLVGLNVGIGLTY